MFYDFVQVQVTRILWVLWRNGYGRKRILAVAVEKMGILGAFGRNFINFGLLRGHVC